MNFPEGDMSFFIFISISYALGLEGSFIGDQRGGILLRLIVRKGSRKAFIGEVVFCLGF